MSLTPLRERTFNESDWYVDSNCRKIEQYVLDDSSNFVSFMYQLIVNLVGSEDDILSFLGLDSQIFGLKQDNLNEPPSFLDDEDFDD